jgi:hypothetical protein
MMNPKIKELADKAQEYAEWMTPQGLEWLDNFKEQFAFLIIEECAQAADTWMEESEGKTFWVGHGIKEHFGVEDERT